MEALAPKCAGDTTKELTAVQPFGVVAGGAVVPGVVGDATGGPVVPVNTVTVPVAAVPLVTGGTVETVDDADGSGVVTVQRQQHML